MPNTSGYDKTNSQSIRNHARRLLNKSLRSFLDKDDIARIEGLAGNKGGLGTIIEEFYFRYRPNNRPEPDFPEAGVELKTGGLLKKGNRLTLKEPRLVLSMIDYMTVGNETWERSTFLRKNSLLLLMLYLYERDRISIDMIFKLIDLWNFSEVDLKILKQDWEAIVAKIRAGKAHELSEGDTYYLGATTKSDVGTTTRAQVGSSVMAKPRAFSLKRTYMEAVIAQLTIRETARRAEPVIKAPSEMAQRSFEEAVIGRFKRFKDMTVQEISDKIGFDLTKPNKAKYAGLARAIMGVRSRRIEEFEKADIAMKTIRLQHDSKPRESMSFPYFKYNEIIEESWEESTLREQFSKKLFFVVFQEDKNGALRFKKAMFWNMPYHVLEGNVRKVWKETVKRIREYRANDLPRQSEDPVCHVRPHAQDSRDTLPAPGGLNVKKQCFWLNKSYIAQQVREQ